MNWRRGFFRAWIFLTVVWVLVVVLFSFERYVSPSVGFKAYMLADSGVIEPVDRFSMKYDALSGSSGVPTPYEKIQLDHGAELFVRAVLTETAKKNAAKTAYESDQSARAATIASHRKIVAFWGLVSAIVPPAILLALGAGLAWVLSGFGQGRRHTDPT